MPTKRDVFIRNKRDAKERGHTIATMYGFALKSGELGLEIEVEGNKFPKPPGKEVCYEPYPLPDSKWWDYVHDGSLRGEDNAEYVIRGPVAFGDCREAITELWDRFESYGSVLDDSNRTSVHVHLNIQEFHLNRLCALMALWFSIEEVLTTWCGETRVGNLFCMNAKDAPAIITKIRPFLRSGEAMKFTEGMHYAGMNPQAIQKLGSLEIRTLRGATDPEIIITWVEILQRLYELSAEFPDPRRICDLFSGGGGAINYLEHLLGRNFPIVMSTLPMNHQEVMESVHDGIQLAQDLCYCRNWAKYEPIDMKADPWGRVTTPSMSIQEVANIQQASLFNSYTTATLASGDSDWINPPRS